MKFKNPDGDSKTPVDIYALLKSSVPNCYGCSPEKKNSVETEYLRDTISNLLETLAGQSKPVLTQAQVFKIITGRTPLEGELM